MKKYILSNVIIKKYFISFLWIPLLFAYSCKDSTTEPEKTEYSIQWNKKHSEQSVSIYAISFSNDGDKVASGGTDNKIKVWNSSNGNLIWQAEEHDWVYSLAFTPDGTKLISGTGNFMAGSNPNDKIKLWNSSNGNLIWENDHYELNGIMISKDGLKLLAYGYTGVLKVWDINTGNLLWSKTQETGCYAEFSSDNQYVVCTFNNKITIYNSLNGNLIKSLTLSYQTTYCSFSNGNGFLAVGGYDNKIKLYDTQNWNIIWEGNHHREVGPIKFSNDDSKILTDLYNGFYVWSTNNGNLVFERSVGTYCFDAKFSMDGSMVLAGSETELQLWNSIDGSLIWSFNTNGRTVSRVEFSPNSAQLLCAIGNEVVVFHRQ